MKKFLSLLLLGLLIPQFCFGYIGYWKLDGNSTDYSGNHYNGTDSGVNYSIKSKINNAGSYGGSTQYSYAASATGMCSFSGLTINFWVYRTSTVAQGFVTKNFTTNDEDWLLIDYNTGDHFPYFQVDDTTGVGHYYIGDVAIASNTWQMVTGVWTGSGRTMATYINGKKTGKKLSNKDTDSFTQRTCGASNNQLWLGRFRGTYFGGYLDDVIVDNFAWSDQKIKTYYAYTRGAF